MSKNPNKKYMVLAIGEGRKNLRDMAGGPFGACIIKNDRILAIARNSVLKEKDATCHAEINAIRIASKKLKTFDLTGTTIYSTNEPCPMCFGAIHWSGISRIVYGTGISDAAALGFNEIGISNTKMRKAVKRAKISVIKGFLRKECLDLLKDWDTLPNKITY